MARVIEAHDLHKVYESGAAETHALRGVSLSVEEGEFVAVDNFVCLTNDCPDLVDPNLSDQVLSLPAEEFWCCSNQGCRSRSRKPEPNYAEIRN